MRKTFYWSLLIHSFSLGGETTVCLEVFYLPG